MNIEYPENGQAMVAMVAHNMVANLGRQLAVDLSVRAIERMLSHVNAEGFDLWLDLHAAIHNAHPSGPRPGERVH